MVPQKLKIEDGSGRHEHFSSWLDLPGNREKFGEDLEGLKGKVPVSRGFPRKKMCLLPYK